MIGKQHAARQEECLMQHTAHRVVHDTNMYGSGKYFCAATPTQHACTYSQPHTKPHPPTCTPLYRIRCFVALVYIHTNHTPTHIHIPFTYDPHTHTVHTQKFAHTENTHMQPSHYTIGKAPTNTCTPTKHLHPNKRHAIHTQPAQQLHAAPAP